MCYKLSTVPGWPESCLSKRRLEFQNEGTRVSSSKRQQAAVGAPAPPPPHKSLLAAVCSAAREMEQTIESRVAISITAPAAISSLSDRPIRWTTEKDGGKKERERKSWATEQVCTVRSESAAAAAASHDHHHQVSISSSMPFWSLFSCQLALNNFDRNLLS